MSDRNAPLEEHTRFRANIQLGDGPDQRGDVTVEVVREPTETGKLRKTTVQLPSGLEVNVEGELATDVVQGVPANDRDFAEFYLELMRGKAALIEALDLDLKLPEVTGADE